MTPGTSFRLPRRALSQEAIVFAIAVLLFLVFSATLDRFLTIDNLLNLLQNVSILGILGVGMALVVIGRGIDLSIVAAMAISVGWTLYLLNSGVALGEALALGAAFAILVGAINGVLIAYVEIPAIFATLAMGTLVYGFGRFALIDVDVAYLPDRLSNVRWLGGGTLLGIPMPVVVFALAATVVWLFLRFTKPGRYVYAVGDNPLTARIAGVPVRPLMLLQYMLSSLIGFVAGMVTASAVSSMNTRVVNSTLVYDVILVVVLGGIGLSGGRGGIRNVVVGTLLIGTLTTGMTILDLNYTMQNMIKSMILLAAIIVDSLLNPRDEQTSQQGDI